MMRAWTAIACVAFFTVLPGVPASEVVASPLVNGEWVVEPKEDGAPRISVRFEKRWVVISMDGEEQVRGLFQIVGRREDGGVKVLVAGEKWAGSEPAPDVVEDPFDPFPGRTHFVMKDLGDDRCAVIFCDGLDWLPRAGIPDVTYRRPAAKP